jgi:DNA-binding transcriptional MerR regulator
MSQASASATQDDRRLTLPELAELLGIEYRTLHTWVRRGVLSASVQASSGTGKPNIFAFTDLVQAQIIADLRHAGVTFELLARTAAALQAQPNALSDPALVLVNGTVEVIADPTEAAGALRREGLTLVYNTAHALEQVRSALTTA